MADYKTPRWLQRLESRYNMLEDGNVKTEISYLEPPTSPGSPTQAKSGSRPKTPISSSSRSTTSEASSDLDPHGRMSEETTASTADGTSVEADKILRSFPRPPASEEAEERQTEPQSPDDRDESIGPSCVLGHEAKPRQRGHHRRCSSAISALPPMPGSANISHTFLSWQNEVRRSFMEAGRIPEVVAMAPVSYDPAVRSRKSERSPRKETCSKSMDALHPEPDTAGDSESVAESMPFVDGQLCASSFQLEIWM